MSELGSRLGPGPFPHANNGLRGDPGPALPGEASASTVAGGGLSLIVVSYNTRDLTRRCLGSATGVLAELGGEAWVVDNASQDGSADMVRAEFPHVRLIANANNVGFGTANNQAMRRAVGRYFLLLNGDVELNAPAVKALVAALEGDASLALVGSCLLAPDGRARPSVRRFPGPLHELLLRFRLFRLLPRRTRARVLLGEHALEGEPVEPDWVTGACMLVRREAFAATDGFDESIFMYGEELEWCARLRSAGWRIAYAPTARVLHVGRASSEPALGLRRIALSLEGDLRYLARYRALPILFAVALIRTLGLAFEMVLGVVTVDRLAIAAAAYQLREHLRLVPRYLGQPRRRAPRETS